jgi:hypothetical protein
MQVSHMPGFHITRIPTFILRLLCHHLPKPTLSSLNGLSFSVVSIFSQLARAFIPPITSSPPSLEVPTLPPTTSTPL